MEICGPPWAGEFHGVQTVNYRICWIYLWICIYIWIYPRIYRGRIRGHIHGYVHGYYISKDMSMDISMDITIDISTDTSMDPDHTRHLELDRGLCHAAVHWTADRAPAVHGPCNP
jgi:hypothetical protein